MTAPPSRFDEIAVALAALGITIAVRPGEYSVNCRGGGESTARYADNLDAALAQGRELALVRPASGQMQAQPAPRRRRPRKMTPKAVRRRMIRAHNRRLRSRAGREQLASGRHDGD